MVKPYIPDDAWSRKARNEGYRARSIYKLAELDAKFRLFTPGQRVLDIGAAPGSWLQYASERVGTKGVVIGLDLQEIEAVAENVRTFVCDVTKIDAAKECLRQANIVKVDCVLSDIAPKTSGVKDVDQWRSVELCRSVLQLAQTMLEQRGVLVMKIFRGADFDAFLAEIKNQFATVRVTTVRASRERSREVYVVCRGKREKAQ